MIHKTIFSTALLPNIDYMAALLEAKSIEIEAKESYKKQSFRNRYDIAGPNGKQTLIIPVIKNGKHNCPISEVQIGYDTNWQKLHWKSWETAYNSSPFFLYYKDSFKLIFDKKHHFLWDFNTELLNLIIDLLEVNIKIDNTKIFEKEPQDALDLREIINPKTLPFHITYPSYYQVFAHKHGFIKNLSVVDLLFNMGNEAYGYLQSVK